MLALAVRLVKDPLYTIDVNNLNLSQVAMHS